MCNLKKLSLLTVVFLATIKANATFENKLKDYVSRAQAKIKQTTSSIEEKFDQLEKKFQEIKDKTKEELETVQNYLDEHDTALISNEFTTGPITLKQMKFNDRKKILMVTPPAQVRGSFEMSVDETKLCEGGNFLIFGIKGRGAQIAIGPIEKGDSSQELTLTAPKEMGVYQIRFRLVEAKSSVEALGQWLDLEGSEPSGTFTLALLVVK